MAIIESSKGRLVIQNKKPTRQVLAFAVWPFLLALAPLGWMLILLTGERPFSTFRCERAANSCDLSKEGESKKKLAWALSDIKGAKVGYGRSGHHLELELASNKFAVISENADGLGSDSEYVRAATEINAFVKGTDPFLAISYRWRPNKHTFIGISIPAAIFLLFALWLLDQARSEDFVFDRDSGLLTITRRGLFRFTKHESIPLSDLIEVDERQIVASTDKNLLQPRHNVELARRRGPPVMVSTHAFSHENSEVLEKALGAFLKVPVKLV